MFRRTVQRLGTRWVLQPYLRLRHGLTLGVRALVRDGEGRILLVRHTYAPGWIFPGGGIERGETAEAAIIRELREEAGVVAMERPRLFGLYSNEEAFPGDHVALFLVDRFEQAERKPSIEIAEVGFFAEADLPAETTGGARRRLEEVAGRREVGEGW